MSRRFYFGSPSDSDEDNDALPYPEPLPRASFLSPDFTPTQFLSSLRNRHQTLEDLRSELRTRSQELSKELLDLVNDNYQEFLGLGDDLRGGDEKVEEIRVALFGFQREISGLEEKTRGRRREVEALIAERNEVARAVRKGKDLLEMHTRLEELERALDLPADTNSATETPAVSSDVDLSESDSESEDGLIPLSRLRRRSGQYAELKRLMYRVGSGHPFTATIAPRYTKVRQTLLLDLASALRQYQRQADGKARVLAVLKLYNQIGEPSEALTVLKAMEKT